MSKKVIPMALVLALTIWTVWPLFGQGFIPTHDSEYHLIRFFEFEKNIRAGILWPRWAGGLNNGQGVPLFNFFYPLPNFIAMIFRFSGFSLITSFNLIMAFSMIFGALFFYLWIKKVFSQQAAVVGAIFYTLAPYHLLDVYVRGSVGEALTLALMPAALWAIETKSFWLAPFLALIILAHNILALMFMPFLLCYIFFLKFLNLRFLAFNFFLGFGLSAIFWLPALVEAKYVTGLQIDNYADHFPTLWQLLIPSWGTGFSVPGIGDQMSFQIGIPHLLAVAAALFLTKKKSRYFKFFIIWLSLLIFLLLPVSSIFWQIIPGMEFFQHPWRFLSLVILVTSFLAAFLANHKHIWWAIGLILLAFIFYAGYSRPVVYPAREDSFYLDNPDWTQGTATLGNSFQSTWLVDPGQTPIRQLATRASLASLIFWGAEVMLKKRCYENRD